MKQLLTLLLVCLSFVAGAQSKRQHQVDSMRIVLSNAKEDTNKVILLEMIGSALEDSCTEETIRYANEALALAQKLDDKGGIAGAYKTIGLANSLEGNYFKALKYDKCALKLDRLLGDKKSEGGSLCNMGNVYNGMDHLNKSLHSFIQAKAILEEINCKPFLANTIASMGYLYIKRINYAKAIECFTQAIDLYKVIANKNGMAVTYNELAWVYFEKQRYDESEDAAVQALALSRDDEYMQGIKDANKTLDKIHAKRRKK